MCSDGIAAAWASRLESPRRTAPKVRTDFMVVWYYDKDEIKVVMNDKKRMPKKEPPRESLKGCSGNLKWRSPGSYMC